MLNKLEGHENKFDLKAGLISFLYSKTYSNFYLKNFLFHLKTLRTLIPILFFKILSLNVKFNKRKIKNCFKAKPSNIVYNFLKLYSLKIQKPFIFHSHQLPTYKCFCMAITQCAQNLALANRNKHDGL